MICEILHAEKILGAENSEILDRHEGRLDGKDKRLMHCRGVEVS